MKHIYFRFSLLSGKSFKLTLKRKNESLRRNDIVSRKK